MWVRKALVVTYVVEGFAYFSSKSFTVSILTFKYLIYFEFIFVYGVRECSNFMLLNVAVFFCI